MSTLVKLDFNTVVKKLFPGRRFDIESRVAGEVYQSRFMNISGLFKPEYIYQPQRALQRLINPLKPIEAEFIEESLPWGVTIRIRPNEERGKSLRVLGVMDLTVSEVLYRLTDPGELAVDVGANIGYMTSILAKRVKLAPQGKVIAFEAHPGVYQELEYNVDRWRQQLSFSQILIHQTAVSDQEGDAILSIPRSFAENRGLASIVTTDEPEKSTGDTSEIDRISIATVKLDDQIPKSTIIDVLKIDVEGHELKVLEGATQLLQQKRIRDCVFEEHRPYPTDVTSYLEQYGYTLFRIHRNFWGVELLPAASPTPRVSWLPTSFLATINPERAILN
jgi:FkbM family methyltransferase